MVPKGNISFVKWFYCMECFFISNTIKLSLSLFGRWRFEGIGTGCGAGMTCDLNGKVTGKIYTNAACGACLDCKECGFPVAGECWDSTMNGLWRIDGEGMHAV